MNKNDISRNIRAAFAGVKLGGGIGLWEGQAIDDYESSEVQKQQRSRDEKEDWSKINYDDLCRCETSLSFFDADGMRFHLPAFLLATLGGEPTDSAVFHLSYLDDYAQSKFVSLSSEQIQAVIMFLRWCKSQDDYGFDAPQIERALSEYWLKF